MKKLIVLIGIITINIFGVQLKAYTFNNGGGSSSSSTATIKASIGESIIGTVDEGLVQLNCGFIVVSSTEPSAIDELTAHNPVDFVILKAYPNPFNSQCAVDVNITNACKSKIEIYRNDGRIIMNETKDLAIGRHTIHWHAKDLESGIYLFVITNGNESRKTKLLLVK